jgi:hypothetical protein
MRREELQTYNSRLLDCVKNGVVQYNTREFDNFERYRYTMGNNLEEVTDETWYRGAIKTFSTVSNTMMTMVVRHGTLRNHLTRIAVAHPARANRFGPGTDVRSLAPPTVEQAELSRRRTCPPDVPAQDLTAGLSICAHLLEATPVREQISWT